MIGGPAGMQPIRAFSVALLILAHGLAAECPATELTPAEARARFRELDKKAQTEFRHGEFAQSADDFRQGGCLAPDNLRSYYELYGIAIGAAAAGDFAQARQVLQEADRQRPDYPLPLAMLVKVSLTSGDVENVKESLRAAAERFPLDGKLHAEFVKDLLHEKLPDLALAESLRFQQSGVKDPEATVTLALLENNAGSFGDAVLRAREIEEQSELSDEVRASGAAIAGLACENLAQLPEAAQHLKRATELAPKLEDSYLSLARVYQKQQNPKAAMEILEEARKRMPESPKLLLALGGSLISVGQFLMASETLAALIKRSPDEFEAYGMLAESYRNMGQPSLATAALGALALRKPDFPMVHLMKAQSMLAEDAVDYPGVLAELTQAEKAAPTDYDVYVLRGKVYVSMEEYEEAVAAFQRAIELRPAEAGAYYQLGLAYRKSGRATLAKQQFDTVEYLKTQAPVP
jgi:tetratricopeptide (TPR) repeat protein